MDFADKELTCAGCHLPFTFTAGEQEFFRDKGFTEEPRRCKPCRDRRKETMAMEHQRVLRRTDAAEEDRHSMERRRRYQAERGR